MSSTGTTRLQSVPRHEVAVVPSSATVAIHCQHEPSHSSQSTALTFQKSKRLSPDLALTRYESTAFTRPVVTGVSRFSKGVAEVVATCVVKAGHRCPCHRQMLHQQNHRFSLIIKLYQLSFQLKPRSTEYLPYFQYWTKHLLKCKCIIVPSYKLK